MSSTNYNDTFETPVLTPGKTFVLGYTNEKNGIYHPRSKVIIFDDFTTASRLVDFDFKVKSSAMKILHSIDDGAFNIEYLYYYLQTIKILNDTHKRFWISEYAPLCIKIHEITEQLEIVKYIKNTLKLIDSITQQKILSVLRLPEYSSPVLFAHLLVEGEHALTVFFGHLYWAAPHHMKLSKYHFSNT